MQTKALKPRLDALPELVAFTARALECEGIDRRLLGSIDFVLEELFTNIVKYGCASGETGVGVQVEVEAISGGVEVRLIADGANDFDVTRAPEVDTSMPLEQRRPGGLGLHLIRRLVDSIEYEYQVSPARSRVTFRKTSA